VFGVHLSLHDRLMIDYGNIYLFIIDYENMIIDFRNSIIYNYTLNKFLKKFMNDYFVFLFIYLFVIGYGNRNGLENVSYYALE